MRPEKYGDCRKLQFFDSLKKQDSSESCFFSYSLISVVYCLFALIHTVQERDDLCTGAAAVRAEQAAADTVGNAIVNRPLDRTCVICVRVYISEIAVAGSGICLGCARQERYAVCSRADGARCKRCIARALGNAVLNCPCNRLGVVRVCRNIAKCTQLLRFGRTRRAPQEGYDLRSGAGKRSERTACRSYRW